LRELRKPVSADSASVIGRISPLETLETIFRVSNDGGEASSTENPKASDTVVRKVESDLPHVPGNLGMRRILLTLVVVLGPVALLEYLNFTGFCYSQARYYRDEELIDAAIRWNIARYGSDPAIKKRYESIGEFKGQNPECCSVSKYGHWSLDPIWVRLFGFYIVVVEVWYQVAEAAPGTDSFYNSLISFDACGKIVNTAGILEAYRPVVPTGRR
jgi:hypothetical protein